MKKKRNITKTRGRESDEKGGTWQRVVWEVDVLGVSTGHSLSSSSADSRGTGRRDGEVGGQKGRSGWGVGVGAVFERCL